MNATPLPCSVEGKPSRFVGLFGISRSPLVKGARFAADQAIQFGGTVIDVTPGREDGLPATERRWFRVLSMVVSGALFGTGICSFLIPLLANAAGESHISTFGPSALLSGCFSGAIVGLMVAARRSGLRRMESI